jgi:hypothetical protein
MSLYFFSSTVNNYSASCTSHHHHHFVYLNCLSVVADARNIHLCSVFHRDLINKYMYMCFELIEFNYVFTPAHLNHSKLETYNLDYPLSLDHFYIFFETLFI